METTVSVVLDTRRAKRDGTFPLILRIIHKRKSSAVPLGISIPLSDWDAKNRRLKNSSKLTTSVARMNNLIERRKAEAMATITRLYESGSLGRLSPSELKKILEGRESSQSTFFSFTAGLIEQMRKANEVGNARVYGGVLGALKAYRNQVDFTFEECSYRFLKEYEAYYYSQGFSTNGLSLNMRTIRAIYNKAIKAGVADQAHYPFRQYRILTEETEKRAIDQSALKKILSLQLGEDHELFHARNYFLASYLMYGLNFIDMAYLKVSNLVDGRIKYKRRKTAKQYDIKISDQLQGILDYYVVNKAPDDYIFPVIVRENIFDQYREIDQARKMYNKQLKQIAQMCDIKEKLTSYVSRHSFATQAMLQDVPVNAISEMLGHASLTTTQIYLKGLPSKVLDEYHDRLSL
jgi:site-specific recombinase XerD